MIQQSADEHVRQGVILGRSGNLEGSRSNFERALRLDPNHAGAHIRLGAVLQAMGDSTGALRHYQKARARAPDNLELNVRLGRVYVELSDNKKAEKCFRKALSLHPGHPEPVCGLASLFGYRGDADRAYAMLAPLLRQRPVSITVATAFAAICRPLGRCPEAVELLEQCLSDGIARESQSQIHFELGKLYDKQKDYGRAFQHFERGNQLAAGSYDPWAEAQWFRAIIEKLDIRFFRQAPRSRKGSKQKRPVFIVGMPRSGSTLVEQIISSHPSAYGAGELFEIPAIAAALQDEPGVSVPYPLCLAQATQESVGRFSRRYLKYISGLSPANANVITDKMLDNYRHLGLIQLLFPKAKVIHCVRKPMDTCLSCFTQRFAGGHFYSYDLRNMGMYYRLYERLMSHWKNTLEIPIMDVSYEDLIADPETVSRSLIEFCGLKWSPRCLQFHEASRDVVTASFDQVRQPLYGGSVERWKNYADYLAPLREGLSKAIL